MVLLASVDPRAVFRVLFFRLLAHTGVAVSSTSLATNRLLAAQWEGKAREGSWQKVRLRARVSTNVTLWTLMFLHHKVQTDDVWKVVAEEGANWPWMPPLQRSVWMEREGRPTGKTELH